MGVFRSVMSLQKRKGCRGMHKRYQRGKTELWGGVGGPGAITRKLFNIDGRRGYK